MAWQIAFLIIASSPARFRLMMMIPSIVEKFGFVVIVAVLHSRARISSADGSVAVPHPILGILFIAAFAKRPASRSRGA